MIDYQEGQNRRESRDWAVWSVWSSNRLRRWGMAEKCILVEASSLDGPEIPLPLPLHRSVLIDLILAGLP